jgi:hypothetical protein
MADHSRHEGVTHQMMGLFGVERRQFRREIIVQRQQCFR